MRVVVEPPEVWFLDFAVVRDVDLEGIKGCGQNSRVLARKHARVHFHFVRCVYESGHRGADAIGQSQRAADMGVVRFFDLQSAGGTNVLVAREHLIYGRIVNCFSVSHRTDLEHMVHLLRQIGQVFTNLNARNGRDDGLVGPADFGRGVGFHIEQIDMAWSAVHVEQDAGFCAVWFSRRIGIVGVRCRRKDEPSQAESAYL